jgi:hypothetical protein
MDVEPDSLKPFEVDAGEFRCPNCRKTTKYRRFELTEVKRFIFFRFKGATVGEYIVCEVCKRKMSVDDLRAGMPNDVRQTLAALKERFAAGIPLEQGLTALVDSGHSTDEARRLVNAAAGILLRRCLPCSLTYVDSVSHCQKCSHGLPLRT